jgi:hypothetical protein
LTKRVQFFSNDDPSFVAVTSIFNSSNYHFWARSMQRALVGGTIPPITDSFDPTSSIVQHCELSLKVVILVTIAIISLKIISINLEFVPIMVKMVIPLKYVISR